MMLGRMKRPRLGVAVLAITGGLAGVLGASPANADLIETINQPNSALSGFTPGYVSLVIHLSDSTHATATFTSLSSGTTLYRIGDGSSADLNVAGSFSAALDSESGTATGFTPTFSAFSSGQVDGWGNFNLTLDNFDGYGDSATQIVINLTATAGNTWVDAQPTCSQTTPMAPTQPLTFSRVLSRQAAIAAQASTPSPITRALRRMAAPIYRFRNPPAWCCSAPLWSGLASSRAAARACKGNRQPSKQPAPPGAGFFAGSLPLNRG